MDLPAFLAAVEVMFSSPVSPCDLEPRIGAPPADA
jgi:hypothetical protein